jgi:hypothetical protein
LLLERPGVDVRDSAYDIVLYDWNDYSSMAIAYNFINAKLKHLQVLNIYISSGAEGYLKSIKGQLSL